MPNWTQNHITIKHADKSRIDLIEATNNTDKGVLATVIPCPEELNDEELTTWSRDDEVRLDAKRAAMMAKYGYVSWYEWNIAHWGTKWDLCEPHIQRIDDNTVVVTCETAWSPPVQAFETMKEMGYEIRALYCGEGPEFAGIWEDGNDNCFNTTNGSKQARAVLPQELNDHFGIADTLEEYERENEEELTQWLKDGVEERTKQLHTEEE